MPKVAAVESAAQKKAKERTYIMVKYDGVQRGKISDVIKRFEKRGYKMVALKLQHRGIEHWR